MRSIDEIARALGRGKEKKVADGWVTTCPAHDDGKASLSIRAPHGKILFKCHAGCSQQAVMEALINEGLWEKRKAHETWKPMRPVPKDVKRPGDVKHTKHGIPVASWEYHELDGTIIGLIYRFEDDKGDKTLIPMSYCYSDKGRKAWIWKAFDKPRPFYNLPLFAKLKDKPVLIVEGEKTADAAQKIFGDDYVCSTWPGGAAAVKYADTSILKGRTVILWPDNDDPGLVSMSDLAEILLEEGGAPKIVSIPPGLEEGWDLADEIPSDVNLDPRALVHRAENYSRVSDPEIAKINREFAFIISGGRPAVLHEKVSNRDGTIDVEFWTVDAFRQYYSNISIPVGRTQAKLGEHWLTHQDRRTYRGIVFEPGKEYEGQYNLWRGFSFEPDGAGDWSIFHDHLLRNICQEDEDLFKWVFGWFAHIIQKPREKAGTSLSIRGEQGTGKTIVGKIFGRLISRHYTLIDQERYLFGNFNSHMASTILLHSDEGFWGGDPRHVGKLKSLVTSDTQRIEHKGRDSLEVNNYLRLLITTNEDWVIPAAFDERRFAVLDAGLDNQQDREFFLEMLRQMSNGGYEGLLYDLMNFDLKSTDIARLPKTSALDQQKEASMDPVEAYWYTCLQQGDTLLMSRSGWLDMVRTAELHDDCIAYLNKLGYRRMPHLNSFFRKIKKMNPPGSMERRLLGPDRQSATTMPYLTEARAYFDRYTRTAHDWARFDLTDYKEEPKPLGEIPF